MNVVFVQCESYGCKNITSDLYKEKFGAYCFEHSSKVKAPFGDKTKFKSLSPISPRRISLVKNPSVNSDDFLPKIVKDIDFSPKKSKTKSKSPKKSLSSYKLASKKNTSLVLPLPGEEVDDFGFTSPEDKEENVHLPLPSEEEQIKSPYISPGMDLTFENYESSPLIVESIKTSVPSPRRNTKFVKKVDCCYCTDPYDISKVMNCGHMICPQCLEGIVRSPYCEFCGNLLEGPFITEKLSMIINNKYKQDLEKLSNEEEYYSEESSEEESSEEE
jgi:hypothetical protein